ncbi:kinesin-1 heavy chain [Drosophila novamexicana]|uniref:kinesin-1 heavy chain n=1 Tax=Drosophila novamexicana TaxID=47314 RepID=UPI0011E5B07B|nr:kinesin-1 heavy chain [Drosophila novamexicana]
MAENEGGAEEQDYEEEDAAMAAMDEGGMEEGIEDDLFSRLGESSDDPEQKRMYMEYLALIKEIDCQNRIIQDIKTQVMDMCGRPCKTRNELREIKRLRICMEQENIKLHTMMNRAVQLQNFGSHRHYRELNLTTTVDEDNISPYCVGPCGTTLGSGATATDCSEEAPSSCCQVEGQEDRLIKALSKAMQKMKGACPEDMKMMQEIACAIMASKSKPKQVCNPGPCAKTPSPCAESSSSIAGPCPPCPPPSCRPSKRSRPHPEPCCPPPCPPPCSPPCPAPCNKSESLDKLKRRIVGMQCSVKKLLNEVSRRETQEPASCPYDDDDDDDDDDDQCGSPCPPRPCPEDPDPLVICGGKRNTKADMYEKMKENYARLLTQFQRKDCQMKELEKRMKGFIGGCGPSKGTSDADAAELNLLRARVNELKEEQLEFKCIMKEQSQQLEDYRNKYMLAQQKVEEQCVSLDKLNMNNKRIEQQINTEVKEIRSKFQEKLNELLHFPKLLENEQLKLAQVCKEKDDLQSKLVVVCKELKSCKVQLENPTPDLSPQLAQCQLDLTQARNEIEELLRQRDLFCEQLKTTQDDLDTLRTESAKIIAGTKERAEMIKAQQQEQINRLEKELAQCRATASLSVNDREAVIREMQGQLNTLSYSFDAAQKQIKTLRNHIAYVSNENCFPVKC